jgi:hypothetical protein
MIPAAGREAGIPQKRMKINVQVTARWRGIVGLPSRMGKKSVSAIEKVKAEVEAESEMKKPDLRPTSTSAYLAR